MFCTRCGARLPEGSRFCPNCGAEAPAQTAPDVSPIAPPETTAGVASPPPPKKKSKALLWTLIGAGAAVIAALVLIFVVFAPGAGWPFAGNTAQTRFINDSFAVFSNAFADTAVYDTEKLMHSPFIAENTISVDYAGMPTELQTVFAYDNKTLGMSISNDDDAIKLMLLEDTLYLESEGETYSISLDSESDLSRDMPLAQRIQSLSLNSASNVDMLQFFELLVNSIDESCFTVSGDKTTLTLTADDLADTLDTFADKLRDNEELNDALKELVQEASDYPLDISALISIAAPMLKTLDFELEWTVVKQNGRPAELMLAAWQDSAPVFEFSFGSEAKQNGKLITSDIGWWDADSMQSVLMEYEYTKTGDTIDYAIDITLPTESIWLEGLTQKSGDSISGYVDVYSSSFADVISVDFEESVRFEMPSKPVQHDNRFTIDMTNVQKLDDILTGQNMFYW